MQRDHIGDGQQLRQRQPIHVGGCRRKYLVAGFPQAARRNHPHAKGLACRADSLAQLAVAHDGEGSSREFPAGIVEQTEVRTLLPGSAAEQLAVLIKP